MRNEFETQLDDLLTAVVAMGEQTDGMLADALQALELGDVGAIDRVRAADARVDRAYESLQHGVLAAVARHGPVGHDLRLLIALVHVSLHVERMGDYAVNVVRTIERAGEFPGDDELTTQLLEMGGRAREVGSSGLRAFANGDLDGARAAGRTDDDVDRLNVGIFHRLVQLAAADEHRLSWATHMLQLPRALERYADHGVDIAEQTFFVVTGTSLQLSDNED